MNAKELISLLDLTKHPSGGYFKVTYCCDVQFSLPCTPTKIQNTTSSVYFLLEETDFLAWHRLKSDEILNYHSGGILTLYIIDSNGKLIQKKLGSLSKNVETNFRCVVPANQWFAASVDNDSEYVLTSSFTSPAYQEHDAEDADRGNLLKHYPQYAELITRFTR